MVRLDYLSVLEFSGSDSAQFLQSQLSADVLAITGGASGFACSCNPAGRVLGLLLIRPGDTSSLVVCATALVAQLAEHLGKFILRSDVCISLRADLAVAGIENADGAAAGAALLRTVTGLSYAVIDAEPPAKDSGAAAVEAWKASEIETGIAWLDAETSGRFLPQMLGFENIGALSFRKGCYPGQEIIARTRYLGKLKRRPLIAHADAAIAPQAMDEITLGGEGREVSAVAVARAVQPEGTTVLFLVARAADDFAAQTLHCVSGTYAARFTKPGAVSVQAQG